MKSQLLVLILNTLELVLIAIGDCHMSTCETVKLTEPFLVYRAKDFIIHPCDHSVVICYLIWPCDIAVRITYLISHRFQGTTCENFMMYGGLYLRIFHHTVSSKAAIYVYNTAVRSGLLYGCSAINISKTNLNTLEKGQSEHIRSILGLNIKTHKLAGFGN